MKKLKIIIYILLIMLVAAILFLNYLLSDGNVIKGYFKSEKYGDKYGFQHYLEYYKYYYEKEKDKEFNMQYYKVKNEDINEIKLYYNDFKERMEKQKRLEEFDLDISIIDESDYFILYDRNNRDFGDYYAKFYYYTLHFYDTSSHILYVLYST